MVVYELPPIDSWSPAWNQLKDNSDADGWCWLPVMAEAFHAAARWLSWDGRLPELPRCCGLPEAYGAHYVVIAWQQSDNSAVFMTSPFRLPSLEDRGGRWIDTRDPQHIVHECRATADVTQC